MPDINKIAANLAREIPPAHKKTTKPAQSWRTLKPNQYLTSLLPFSHDGRVAPAGSLWHVLAVDSSGADIATVDVKPLNFHWELAEWKGKYFVRARKPSQSRLTELLVESLK